MSSIIVRTVPITSVQHHPNADKLDLAIIGEWQCIVARDRYKAGDLVTYIPPDAVLPDELAERLGVKQYLSKGNRVRAVRLRGEPSFGLVMEPSGPEGENIAEQLGITQWVPPPRGHGQFFGGRAINEDPQFKRYTDIENLRHFNWVLEEGEIVVGMEKIHGTNSRVGYIRREDGTYEKVTGSRRMQRAIDDEASVYNFPWTVPGVQELMNHLVESLQPSRVFIYGELYGRIQALRYGLGDGLAYAAFDILVNDSWLPFDEFMALCTHYNIPTAPVLYRGPFSMEACRATAKGYSTLPGANHIREGVVVRPVDNRHDPRFGRVILKFVSDEFLTGDFDDAGE